MTISKKLFSRYVETPTQLFDLYDGIDPAFILIYSNMMNHYDYAKKTKRQYEESLDSIAYLAHVSKSTAKRKIEELIQAGLIEKFERPNKKNVWVIHPLSRCKLPKREANSDRARRVREVQFETYEESEESEQVNLNHQAGQFELPEQVNLNHQAGQFEPRNSSINSSKNSSLNSSAESQKMSQGDSMESSELFTEELNKEEEMNCDKNSDKKPASRPVDVSKFNWDDEPVTDPDDEPRKPTGTPFSFSGGRVPTRPAKKQSFEPDYEDDETNY
ncbi:hypothetical protein [Escherichia coli]|uniref:hypothetical protein n=1 Tax=Escherichia coli TaxID=562 RepID=UPI001CA76DBD|nr:hypothetical protein [Escherichia coli]QZY67679.1 hypothetical protein K7X33_16425 [Escherichia coli]